MSQQDSLTTTALCTGHSGETKASGAAIRKEIKLSLLFASLFLSLLPLFTSAQSRPITGTITSANGEPLGGVSVIIEGTSTGTTSNDNGQFNINATTGNRLVFSLLNHQELILSIDERSDYRIVMLTNASELDSLVVIGYGRARKKDLTGSVATVDIKGQERTPVISTEQMLQGRVSGVQVTQNQSQPGGAVFSVRIRGTNSINSGNEPLYVIDGYAGADILALNPTDIASMTVLKDASSTAIYGSRGANGVVLITTKRGAGAKSLTIDAYTGVQRVAKKYDMMDAKEFARYLNTVQTETNLQNGSSDPLPYTQADIDAMGKGTDWQNEVFRTAPISNIALSLNGGNADTRYFATLSYFDQKGVMIGTDYKRGIARFNVDHKVSSKIRLGISSSLSYDYQNVASVNTDGGSTSPGVLWDAVRFNPQLPVRDADGEYTYQNGPMPFVGPLGNPVAFAGEAQNNVYIFRGFLNVFGEYDIAKSLRFRTSFGVNYDNRGGKNFLPSNIFAGAATNGAAGQSSGQNYNYLTENTLTFNKIFDNHSLNAVGGFTFQQFMYKSFSTGITNLANNNLGYNNLGIGDPNIPFASFDENALASFFGRINYGFKDKYLLTFTARGDGSSRFGEKNKWGFFPSGAIAWNISEEDFLKNSKHISELKLRASYGITGNQEIGNYITQPVYINTIYSLGRDPSPVTAIQPTQLPNPDIQWEQTATTDIGLDLGLLNNRIQITTDYYHKKTTNLLLYINIPQSTGYSTILRNIGAVQNKGFEFAITTQNIKTSSFTWTSNLNFSINKNKVLDLGENEQIYVGDLSGNIFLGGGTSAILQPGKSIGSFYGNVFDGIWQSQDAIDKSGTQQPVVPGDPIYRDTDGDSILSGDDRTIIGQALPKYIYSFTNDFTYGRFGLNIFLQGVYGNKIFNENRYEIENGFPIFNKLKKVGTESWTGPGTSNDLPSVSSTYRRGAGFSSEMLEDGSFLRVKSVTLSYQVPVRPGSKTFKSASVYVTGQNLLTITNYSGYDPEVNSFDASNQLSLGTDYNAYPNYRSVLVGVKLSF
jgi:TonB-dependent starch-binding outer membrane protein SusC